MRPLMIIKLPDNMDEEHSDDIHKYFHKLSMGMLSEYDIIVHSGLDIKVYYPSKPISFYYQKIKTWLILKIAKRN